MKVWDEGGDSIMGGRCRQPRGLRRRAFHRHPLRGARKVVVGRNRAVFFHDAFHVRA
jgi:hypothetical protein